MSYKNTLTEMMGKLNSIDNTIFIGQQVLFSGNPMSSTLENVDKNKIIELPVMEDSQMGMSLGLAMAGNFVISLYPRWDFLICASNQLINHLDKIELMSNGQWKPNIIIRVGKGSDNPLDPGHQHKGNYYKQYYEMCNKIKYFDCHTVDDLEYAYGYAMNFGGIYMINEYPEKYGK